MTDNNESGVIDITNLVESMKSTFVTWASDFIFTEVAAIPALTWLTFPVINVIFKAILKTILTILANSAILGSFFLNTSLRKASQAQDYADALTVKNNLPIDASDDEYAKAEQAEINAFNSFVILGN